MSNADESKNLPSIQLFENHEWKTVGLNGKEKLIPNEWMVENVGENIDFKLGNTPPKTGSNYDGNTPWVTISNISGPLTTSCTAKIDYEKARILPKGSLVGSFKMTIGRFSILGMDAATNEAIVGVSPDGAPGFSLDYLRFALVEPFVGGASTNGQGVQLLNTKTIKSLGFVAPPLPEQTLIAQVLTAQESQVNDLRKLAQAERQLLAWLSEELLSGRLRVEKNLTAESVVVSRNEKGEPVEVLPGVKVVENRGWKTVEVNERETKIPDSWAVAGLGGLFRFVNGSAFKPSDWGQNGMKIVRIQNLSNPDAEYNYTTKKPDDVVTIDNDDILMSWSGTIDIFRWTGDLAALNQHIFRVDVKSGTDKNFAVVLLKNTIHYLRSQAHGATMVHIRKGVVEEAECLVPPIPEQILIAQVLTAQETQVLEIERLADLEQQRFEWLSEELLSGRIRVKTTKED